MIHEYIRLTAGLSEHDTRSAFRILVQKLALRHSMDVLRIIHERIKSTGAKGTDGMDPFHGRSEDDTRTPGMEPGIERLSEEDGWMDDT